MWIIPTTAMNMDVRLGRWFASMLDASRFALFGKLTT